MLGARTLALLAVMTAASAIAAPPVDDALVRVSQRARPAVVHVEVEKAEIWAPALRELLESVGAESPMSDEPASRATGSAVIVSADGRVITNHHVVEGALSVMLVLADQRRFPATVLGADARTDIAVLQIDGPGPFPWLPLGDSDRLRVGQAVLAVGSPFDFQSTVTVGIVSAMGRRGLDEAEIQDYIQTDAAVNPGNSGGPLVDLDGRIVGINTAIYSQGAEQNSGVSFAVPVNMARRVVDALVAGEPVPRAAIGVDAVDVESVDGDPTRRGAEISWVVPGSPASRAGLRRGDVVVSVDGEPMPTVADLRNRIRAGTVGGTVRVEVARAELREVVEVVLAAEDAVGTDAGVEAEGMRWAGLIAVDDTEALRARLGVPAGEGALVARVDPGSDAARMGVLAGDRIVEIAGQPIRGVGSLQALLPMLSLGPVVVKLDRAGFPSLTVLPSP